MASNWADATRDWDAEYEARRYSGLERTCHACGCPVMVRRDETYTLQVFCECCQLPQADAAKDVA